MKVNNFNKNFNSILFLTIGMLFLVEGFAQSSKKEPPNIIFFFTDDQAYDTQKDFGNPDVKTPNMDKLADEGMVFTRHYNTTAICMASRANVMIGQYEYKTGCNFEHGPMKLEKWENAYPLLLKESGYSVGFGGKFGYLCTFDKPVKCGLSFLYSTPSLLILIKLRQKCIVILCERFR